MPSVPVNIENNVIEWALQCASVIKNTDAVEYLLSWKEGKRKPTFNQVETVSKATRIPLGYFFLKSPPVEDIPILQFRTIGSIDINELSRDVIDIYNHMDSVQNWMRDYMIDAGYDKLGLVGSLNTNQDASVLVKQFREILNIPVNWHDKTTTKVDAFKFFRERLESVGILIMMSGIVGNNTRRALSIEEFRAFTLIDDYAPLIFINANDSDGAKLFSLLHETAHVLLGVSSFYNDRYGYTNEVSTIEILSNAIAAEVLVPSIIFEKEWQRLSSVDDLSKKMQSLSSTFKCGIVVVARKALDNKYIYKEHYKAIVDGAIAHFRASRDKTTGGNFYSTNAVRIDNRFLLALDNSVKTGKTQYTDAFRLTNTNRTTFSNLVDEVRGVV